MNVHNRESHDSIWVAMSQFGVIFIFSIIASGVIYIWTESLIGFIFVGITSLFWGISTIFMTRFNPETAKYYIYNNRWIHQGYFYILDGFILVLLGIILMFLQ